MQSAPGHSVVVGGCTTKAEAVCQLVRMYALFEEVSVVCDAQIIQSKLKLQGSTFLLPTDHQRNHEFLVQGAHWQACD